MHVWSKGKEKPLGIKNGVVSAIQVKHGLPKVQSTYLVVLLEVKLDILVEVPNEITDMLKEFGDMIPSKLPKELPPRRAVDQQIDIVIP